MAANLVVPIDMVSDVVCPWCYIGKSLIERAIAMAPEIEVELRFHPYFLNPWVPRQGMSRDDYLIAKFGSVEAYNANSGRVEAAAAAVGLTYARDRIKRQPNTLDCHRLILWAGATRKSAAIKQRLMEINFSEGGDLSDRDVLVQAAVDCGLDGEHIRALLESNADIDLVEAEVANAKEAGIEGVPCFIFGGIFAVSGAQAPEHLADAIRRAAAELAKRDAAE
jgi:predicted DsbA family dithiol-disulfide isomerase